MQNELKQAIRFDDFYALFGDKGVVTMAWWLGGQLAESIREEQDSFPLLHLCGGPESCKTILVQYLSKLTGPGSMTHLSLCHSTRTSRIQAIRDSTNRVLVHEFDQAPAPDFCWDDLKALYNSATYFTHTGEDTGAVNFKGAVMIRSNAEWECSEAVASRLVRLDLKAPPYTGYRQAHEVFKLRAEQAGAFGRAITLNRDKLLKDILGLASIYTAVLLRGYAGPLTAREAKNGGQLLALIEAVSLLLGLSHKQRCAAVREVISSISNDFIRF